MAITAALGELSGDYALDTAHTRIGFVARHTIGPKVRGRFEEFEGGGYLDGDDPSKSRVELTIQAGSIQTDNAKRECELDRRRGSGRQEGDAGVRRRRRPADLTGQARVSLDPVADGRGLGPRGHGAGPKARRTTYHASNVSG